MTDEAAGDAVLRTATVAAAAQFGTRLSAAYAIGSLAHGGFSSLVSDVDLVLVLGDIDETTAEQIAEIQETVQAASDDELAQRLSIFWSDWTGVRRGIRAIGRLPELDRLDLLESGRLLLGVDRRQPAERPSIEDILQQTAEFAVHKFDDAYIQRLKDPVRLVEAGPRVTTKAALFPIRFLYTLATGLIGRNDDAAAWFTRVSPHGELASSAMRWRFDGLSGGDVLSVLEQHLIPTYVGFAAQYAEQLDVSGSPDLAAELRRWAQRLE